MTLNTLFLGTLLLAATAQAPALAQMNKEMMSDHYKGMMSDHDNGMMASNDHMKMSKSDMVYMKRCPSMTQAKMMKNRKCAGMMKMHPDMMKTHADMMKSGGKM